MFKKREPIEIIIFAGVLFAVLFTLLITNTAKAVSFPDASRWTATNALQVEVFDFDTNDLDIAECTADYIRDNLGVIGKGVNFFVSGYALVDIIVEDHVKNKDIDDFKIRCVSIDQQ